MFTDFALLTPGVATSRTSLGTTFTEYEATQISFGGMRSFSNEITVDGADFVNSASGIQRSTPPQESVQEFRVVNNSFGAEYGRAIGGIVNIVTKGGTNDFHGSAYEYFQNNALDSANLLQKAEPGLQRRRCPTRCSRISTAARIGGPIQKDKTFFFANYEGKRRAESPLFPPDLVNNIQRDRRRKSADGLGSGRLHAAEDWRLAAELAGLGVYSPIPRVGFLKNFLKTANNDYGFLRVDHQFNQTSGFRPLQRRRCARLRRARRPDLGWRRHRRTKRRPRPVHPRPISRSHAGFDTASNLVNTFLAQYARRHYNFPGMTGQPDFSILNDLEVGHNFGTNDRLYEIACGSGRFAFLGQGQPHLASSGFDGNYVWSLENFPGFMPVRMLVPTGGAMPRLAWRTLRIFTPQPSDHGVQFPARSSGGGAACPVPQDEGVVFTYAGVRTSRFSRFRAGPPLVGPGVRTAP